MIMLAALWYIFYAVFGAIGFVIRLSATLLYMLYKEYFTKEGYVPSPELERYMKVKQIEKDFHTRWNNQ